MAGLFDTTNDPEAAVMQRRQQANQALGSPYGKYAGIVQAGGMFADTAADAIAGGGYGSADPTMAKSIELKKIAAVVAQQFPGKTDTPDYYKALALAVNDKYPEKAKEAMAIATKKEQEAQQAKLTDLQIKGAQSKLDEVEASKQAAARSKQAREKAVNAMFPEADQGTKEAITDDADVFKSLITEKYKVKNIPTQVVTVGDRIKLINTQTGQEITDVGEAPKKEGTKVEVNLGDKGSAAYGQAIGKGVAEQDMALVQSAQTSGENLNKIQDTLDLLKKGEPTTGIGAELLNNVDRVKAQFLNDKKAGKKVTDTQVLDALLGSEVFPMIGALGIGARGLDTPAEREFLRGVFTGTIQMDKNTLIKLTETRKKIAERIVNKYNKMLASGDLANYEQAQGRKLRPIEIKTNMINTTSAGTAYKIIKD